MKKTIGLLGKTLAHSFSKQFFTEKFIRENIYNYEYVNFELEDIQNFSKLLEQYPNLIGLNVTIPYKEQVLPFVDECDEIVKEIGAANTLKISKNGKISAYNTDVFGFTESIKPLLKTHHKNALILGSGGASKAIKYALNKMNIAAIIVSRNPKNSDEISYQDLDENTVKNNQIVVNTTPLGSYPNTETFPCFPYDFIDENYIFYDLVYNPAPTIFLKKANKNGAITINGLKMLHLQAEQSWKIWTKKPH
jgi:shikimate dehydrogenase